jgi:Mycothiol maleylpyruvate isomerase N-terminal domain
LPGMSEVDRAAVEGALESAYQNITAVADGLSDAELMLPSRCAGWAIGDVLYHELLDARRALRAFASPATEPPDVDAVSYWRSFGPVSGEHEALGAAQAARPVVKDVLGLAGPATPMGDDSGGPATPMGRQRRAGDTIRPARRPAAGRLECPVRSGFSGQAPAISARRRVSAWRV